MPKSKNRVLGVFTSLSEIERINFIERVKINSRRKALLNRLTKHELTISRYNNRIRSTRSKGIETLKAIERIIHGDKHNSKGSSINKTNKKDK